MRDFCWRALAGALLTLGLVACTTQPPAYQALESRPADATYQRIPLGLTTSQGDTTVIVFLKAFDVGGALGLCGYYLENATSRGSQLVREMFRSPNSLITVGGTPVADTGFILPNRFANSETDARAGCIRTPIGWQPGFLGSPIRLDLSGVRLS